MALVLGDNFSYQGSKPLDARLKYSTLADMKAVADATMYDGCMAYCVATDKTYQWKSTNEVDTDTGRWREFSSGGGGSYTAGDGIDITNDVISTKQSEEGDIDEIIDTYPTAGNLVSIVNAFNKGDIYSTDEKMIGRWIDGKPLYQLVVPYSFTGVTARTYTNILDLTSYNIDTFVNAKGYIINSNSDVKTKSFPLADQNNRINAVYDRTTKYLQLLTYEVNGWILSGHVIVQYTKTTDSAISIGEETEYSTDEKVVGTWIDGKPIYQKTWNIDTSAIAPATTTPIITKSDFNMSEIISVKGMAYQSTAGYSYPLNFKSDDIGVMVWERAGTTIGYRLESENSTMRMRKVILTIQYTKTT